jgi:uncharacterized protein with FMN-binding domain
MRRTPIVITATLAGLAGVLAFHTTPAKLSLGTLPGASGSAQPSTATSPGRSQRSQSASAGAGSPSRSSPTAKAKPGATRTIVGPAVNYRFGVLSVSVSVSGNKITKVGIASLDDGGNQRSQFIDQQSIPILEQETLQAQSGNIQGVSGASYTSAGFQQSLQAALHTLGFQ